MYIVYMPGDEWGEYVFARTTGQAKSEIIRLDYVEPDDYIYIHARKLKSDVKQRLRGVVPEKDKLHPGFNNEGY